MLPDELLQNPVILASALKGLSNALSSDHIQEALKLKDKFNIQPSEINQCVREAIVTAFNTGNSYVALNIVEDFGVPSAILLSDEMQELALSEFNSCVLHNSIDMAKDIKEAFNLGDDVASMA